MNKAKRITAGLIAGAAVLGGVTLGAGTAAADCTYHSRVMFGNAIIDGYGGGPQQATNAAFKKAKAKGISTARAKVMWTQAECG